MEFNNLDIFIGIIAIVIGWKVMRCITEWGSYDC